MGKKYYKVVWSILTKFTAGLDYYFKGYPRLSVNYEFRNDRSNPELENLFIVQMQVTL